MPTCACTIGREQRRQIRSSARRMSQFDTGRAGGMTRIVRGAPRLRAND